MRAVMNDAARQLREKIKLPAGQVLQENRCNTDGNLIRIVTSDAAKAKWYLYDVSADGKLTKVCTGDSPLFGQSRR